jgi:hypothetical protein
MIVMYESKRQYEAIVREKVLVLEWAEGHRIEQGEEGECPACGMPGQYDIDGLGFSADVGNAIYYSTVFNEWRCRICDYRRIH